MTNIEFPKLIRHMHQIITKDSPGCLMTLGAPMGSGKTYGIIQYISHKMIADSSFRVFFVANQLTGLHENAFFSAILAAYQEAYGPFATTADQKWYLDQHVAILKSLPNSVAALLETPLPPELNTNQIHHFMEILSQYHRRYQNRPSDSISDGSADWQNLKNAYEEVKRAIVETVASALHLSVPLSRVDRHKIQQYVATQKTALTAFLVHCFSTIDLEKRQLVILTSAKLISTYLDFFTGKSLPVSRKQCLGNALIVIDEIDNLKPIILDKIIDDAQRFPIDFLPFFKEVYAGVNHPQKKRPVGILKILRKDHQLSTLKHLINNLAQEYELEEDYKTVNIQTTNNFIFTLDNITETTHGPWWSRQDKEKQQVTIYTGKSPQENNLHFYRMLRRMGHFQMTLARLINDWAMQYQQKVNRQRQALDNQFSLNDAILTICDCLGFSTESKQLMMALHQRLGHLHGKPLNLPKGQYGQYLQRTGLQLFSMTDGDAHLNRTSLGAVFIQETPEKFLLKLAQRGPVLGVSATVDVETVLGNFDFNFLREQLGDHLLDGNQDLSATTRQQFDVSQRCRQQGISVKILPVISEYGDVEDGQCMRRLIRKRLPDFSEQSVLNPHLRQLEDIVRQLTCDIRRVNDNDQSCSYYQNRYLDLFDSFICFLIQPKMPTFLGLQSVSPKSQGEPNESQMAATSIGQVFNLLAIILCSQEKNQPQLRLIKKKQDIERQTIEEQINQALMLPEKDETRVYLLSAYQTLGVGQNLVHNIGVLEKKWAINIAPQDAEISDSRHRKIDISGIYYGPITHIFSNTNQDFSKQLTRSWILKYYQLYSLVDNHEISLLDVKKYARAQSQRRHVPQLRQSISYFGAQTRIVLQAAGRLDRTFNKVPTTLVVVSSDILNYFNVFPLQDYQLGPIAQALRTYQQQKKMPAFTPEQATRNEWENQTLKTQKTVDYLKQHLQERGPANRFKHYRDELIHYPTVGFEHYHANEDKPEFAYLHEATTCYHVQRQGETFTFLPDNLGNEIVSAENTGLTAMMHNSLLAAHFDALHYPKHWEKLAYTLNPVQADSYKGRLGEICGQCLLEHYWHVTLTELPLQFNEFFDFETANKVLIDFKNWQQPHQRNFKQERQHVQEKLDVIRQNKPTENWRVLIINILQPRGDQVFHIQAVNSQHILEVPYLLNQKGVFILTPAQQQRVAKFLNG
ncbi:MAG TPA: hypothetical protein H9875_07890 [Candidatus Levilactobacillus faecigallinarum]|uniref:Helicase/UvrB N-terminal domain-containing protein n=1 Tax=Candidatus Levilactobacillus faecigallinarum TaxID=2838638 RepID=A0A9D1QTS9_9LACO|nr:hypothetical protein [Candidatus Levilactobacillus faecigallinarum]